MSSQLKLEIINEALCLVGADQVDSLEQGSANSRAALSTYETTLEGVLECHNWNFAIVTDMLTPIKADLPPCRYKYAYEFPIFPVKALRIACIGEDVKRCCHCSCSCGCISCTDWAVESIILRTGECKTDKQQKVLLASQTEKLPVMYVGRTDESSFSAKFRELFALKLASKIIMKVNGDLQDKIALEEQYRRLLKEAKRVDSQETGERAIFRVESEDENCYRLGT